MPKKGLLFYGGTGTGKTMLTKIIAKLTPRTVQDPGQLPIQYKFDFLESRLLSEKYSQLGLQKFNELYKPQFENHLILDDLGSEIDFKHFGQGGSMDIVLNQRFKQYENFKTYTIITSNVKSIQELTKVYGERLTDRLMSMCHFVELKGNSKRF